MSYTLIDNEVKKQRKFHIDSDLARIEFIKAQGFFLIRIDGSAKFESKGFGIYL